MRIEVGTVRVSSVLALTAVGAAWACSLAAQNPAGDANGEVIIQFLAAYLVTLLGFAGLPRTRRSDIFKVVILVAILGQLALLLGRGTRLSALGADAAGALAVFVPSFMERFRSLVRADPHEPFSMVYPDNRRRRSMRGAAKSRPLPGASIRSAGA